MLRSKNASGGAARQSCAEEQREAETLTLAAARIGDVGTPDEAAAQQYYDDNAIRFTAPEATTEVEWVNRSRERRIPAGELWAEITGANQAYRELADPIHRTATQPAQ